LAARRCGIGFCRFPILDSSGAERRQGESRILSPREIVSRALLRGNENSLGASDGAKASFFGIKSVVEDYRPYVPVAGRGRSLFS
jgi:hypothetical protein